MDKQLRTQKDNLARLMATEDLTIVHKKVPTAYFDVKNRILCCPTFKDDISPQLYDLFMGHEVGHALHTPYEGLHSTLKENRTLKGYLNVVEDVRIEKAIKNKYEGLRRSFYTAYDDLMNRDFFGLKKMSIPLSGLSLIDKINNNELNIRHQQIMEIINQNNSDLLVFAENDYPYQISNLKELDFITSRLNKDQSIVIGGTKKDNLKFYNTFFLIERDTIQDFDKIILVPFGEFLPFRIFLHFIDKIVGSNDFSPGNKTRFIKTSNNLKMIPIICYEIIFFNNLLNKYNENSDILINITNDSWFGDFSGPYQHFYLTRMRATEFNKTLIRVSGNGISAVINNKGKVLDYIPLNKKGIKRFKIPIYLNSLPNLTNYHSLIFILLFMLFILAIVFNKKNNN